MTAQVSVLLEGDSMHEARRQRMHSHQFAARLKKVAVAGGAQWTVWWNVGDRREQVGDVVRRLTNQGLVHEVLHFQLRY